MELICERFIVSNPVKDGLVARRLKVCLLVDLLASGVFFHQAAENRVLALFANLLYNPALRVLLLL